MVKRRTKKAHHSHVTPHSVEPVTEHDVEQDNSMTYLFSGRAMWRIAQRSVIPSLLIIAILISLSFRLTPLGLPIADIWAQQTIDNQIRMSIAEQIQQQYPNLPEENRLARIDQEFQRYVVENQELYFRSIVEGGEYFRSRFQDEHGVTYLTGIDPYYYKRLTRNYVLNGHSGEFLVDGVPTTNLVLAPSLTTLHFDLHVWYQAMLFRVGSVLNPSLTIDRIAHVLFFSQPVLIALALIPAFFIGKLFAGYLGGFIAAAYMGMHPSILMRTMGGFADTDANTVLFPLLIMFTILAALNTQKRWLQYSLAALSGWITILFQLAWIGWWYIFDFVSIAVIGYVVYLVFMEVVVLRKSIGVVWSRVKYILFVGGIYIGSSILFFVAMGGTIGGFFRTTVLGPLGFTSIRTVAHANLWPNVYTTVAELNPGSIPLVVQQLGGIIIFALIFYGLCLLLVTTKRFSVADYIFAASSIIWYPAVIFWGATNRIGVVSLFGFQISELIVFIVLLGIPIAAGLVKQSIEGQQSDFRSVGVILMFVWIIGSLYAATQGIRFTLLLGPPAVIGVAIFLGNIQMKLSDVLSRALDLARAPFSIFFFILFVPFLMIPLGTAQQIAENHVPIMNDAWYETLTEIRDTADSDAIISSWWDFGHMFTAIAQRGATADGGSQNTPQAHWLGRLLISDDIGESIGVLRMLNCDANNAFVQVDEEFNDTYLSVQLLESLFGTTLDEARLILSNHGFSDDRVESIVRSTHCDPPQSFIIASGDMVGKAGVWGHFGSWDFGRARVWNVARSPNQSVALDTIQTILGVDQTQAQSVLFELRRYNQQQGNTWISPWPQYHVMPAACQIEQNVHQCGNGIVLDGDVAYLISMEGPIMPSTIVRYGADGIRSILTPEEGHPELGITIWEDQGILYSLASHPLLSGSLFTQLFFIGQAPYINYFSDRVQVTGDRIAVFTVDWEAYLADNPGAIARH